MYMHLKFFSFPLLSSASPSLSSSTCSPFFCSWCPERNSCLPLGTCCVSTPTCCSDPSIKSLPSCLRRQCRAQSKPRPSSHPKTYYNSIGCWHYFGSHFYSFCAGWYWWHYWFLNLEKFTQNVPGPSSL